MAWRRPELGRSTTTGILAAAAAFVATITSRSGEIVADARYEHFVAPGQFLARHADLWDAERGAGEPARYFSPVVASLQSLLAAAAVPPWVIERLTHTAYLTLAAVGACLAAGAVVTIGHRWFPVLAGLLYAFNPYTSQFLTPSGLFLSYALAPWFVWLTLRALEAERQRRWAAGVAVAIFCVGLLNTATLIFALVPAALTVVVRSVLPPRVDGRALARFVGLSALLVMGVSAAMLTVATFSAPQVRLNLDTTESVAAISRTSSAGESWRGLGLWLTYFSPGGRPFGTTMEWYFTSLPMVMVSFASTLLASVGLGVVRGWSRRLLALLVGLSVVLMAGAHRAADSGVLAGWIETATEGPALIRGLRTTYKAGAGLQLGLALLAAAGVVTLLAKGGRPIRRVAGTMAVGLLVVAAAPFWTGSVYPAGSGARSVPTYWDDVFDWFDERPSDQRVLVLPGVSRSEYRWGRINDTMFDARLAQPAIMSHGLPAGTNEIIDLIWTLDEYASSSAHEPGALSAMLRRIGVRWVLVQNDLDWQAMQISRPSSFAALRSDPGLQLVATFGPPGLNTTSPDDPVASFLGERELSPVEIYEVSGVQPAISLESDSPLLLAGAGDSWPALAARGLLDRPVQSLATVSDEALALLLDRRAPVLITDGARRRAMRASASGIARSHTMALGEPSDRAVQAISDDPLDQTVAEFGGLRLVTASDYGPFPQSWARTNRPAAATDGDPATAWTVSADTAVGSWWRAELAEPADLVSIGIIAHGDAVALRRVTGLEIDLERVDGRQESLLVAVPPSDPDGFAVPIEEGSAVAAVTVRIDRLGGIGGSPVGLAEVVFETAEGPIDARERLRAPSPFEPTTIGVPSSVAYLFSRWPQSGTGAPEERGMIRRFDLVSESSFLLDARIRFTADTPDSTVEALLAGSVGASADQRHLNAPSSTGLHAIDANPATAWSFTPNSGAELDIDLETTVLDAVQIDVELDAPTVRRSAISAVDVLLENDEVVVASTRVLVGRRPPCGAGEACLVSVEAAFVPTVANRIVIRPVQFAVSTTTGGFVAPAAIAAVRGMSEGTDVTSAALRPADSECIPLFLIDGRTVAVRPRTPVVTPFDLAVGVTYESCEPIVLDAGTHLLETVPQAAGAVLDVMLVPPGWGSDESDSPVAVEPVDEGGAASADVVLAPGAMGILRTDRSSHPGWRARGSGVEIGEALSLDGGTAWFVSVDEEPGEVQIRFAPERLYRIAWLVTVATLAVCLWILLPFRFWRRR